MALPRIARTERFLCTWLRCVLLPGLGAQVCTFLRALGEWMDLIWLPWLYNHGSTLSIWPVPVSFARRGLLTTLRVIHGCMPCILIAARHFVIGREKT